MIKEIVKTFFVIIGFIFIYLMGVARPDSFDYFTGFLLYSLGIIIGIIFARSKL